ncbi:MAG: hypothetical protein IPK74_39360 [Deltaproteobacteria bacterium]|nr:hypothetical protein [Deltaproteobacteria bacterium]
MAGDIDLHSTAADVDAWSEGPWVTVRANLPAEAMIAGSDAFELRMPERTARIARERVRFDLAASMRTPAGGDRARLIAGAAAPTAPRRVRAPVCDGDRLGRCPDVANAASLAVRHAAPTLLAQRRRRGGPRGSSLPRWCRAPRRRNPKRTGKGGDVGLGASLGDPTGATLKVFLHPRHALESGAGFGPFHRGGGRIHATYLFHSRAWRDDEGFSLHGYVGVGLGVALW